jgi:hypothetical protein
MTVAENIGSNMLNPLETERLSSIESISQKSNPDQDNKYNKNLLFPTSQRLVIRTHRYH